jgi:hypothetical protein
VKYFVVTVKRTILEETTVKANSMEEAEDIVSEDMDFDGTEIAEIDFEIKKTRERE